PLREGQLNARKLLAALVVAASGVVQTGALGAPERTATVRVDSDAGLAAAVAAFGDSGGTIVLAPRAYGELVVGPRSARPLLIVGSGGARVERLVLDHTEHVSIEQVRVAPAAGDAVVEIDGSDNVDLDRLHVTAAGTPYSASVLIPA